MAIHGVTRKITRCLRIECKFWRGENGWQGTCEQTAITVHSDSFELVKSEMEYELGKRIDLLLPHDQKGLGHAA
jgi:hypothetical protein